MQNLIRFFLVFYLVASSATVGAEVNANIWKPSAAANQNGVESSMLKKRRQVSQDENLLLNGNFEIGSLSGWNTYCCDPWPYGAVGPTYGPSSGVFFDPLHPPGVLPENFAALINSAVENDVSYLQTQLPAREGDVFNLRGRIMREAAGNPYSFSLLKIVFEDEDGYHLEPAGYLIGAPCNCFPWLGIESDFVTSLDASRIWHFREAKGRAPAGTTRVSFFALNVDFGRNQFGDSRIWFDDLKVTEFPDDYSARMLIESKELIDRYYESTGNASVANLNKHLEAAIDLEIKGNTRASLSQIQIVVERIDGCHFNGAPDRRGQSQDYIEDCNLQSKLISRLHAAKAGLR